jgi:hypothetical protein
MAAAAAYLSRVRILAILIIVAGAILVVGGVVTWIAVQTQLSDESITVSEDASYFAGDKVDGPLTAYVEANTIEKHALEATGGRTYAELDREDPARQTAMTASFLRASLFTSVVSFGVAAMAAGIGVALILIGWALHSFGAHSHHHGASVIDRRHRQGVCLTGVRV